MFRKLSQTKLLVLFGILAIATIAVYLYDSRKGDRSFRSELFSVDTAAVTTIRIYGIGAGNDPLVLQRNGPTWEIVAKNQRFPADSNEIRNLLANLVNVKAERVAASDASGWKDLEITDSLARHVVVEQNGETVADFRVGKVSFTQGGGGRQFGGRNQGFSLQSHIRVTGDDRVYLVDNYLSMAISDQPARYRNRLLCRFDPAAVSKLTFIYPGDSSFMITRSGTGWLLNGKPADSAKTATFIGSIANLTGSEFADQAALPVQFPMQLRIEGNNMEPLEITAACDTALKTCYIRTSANPQATFTSPLTGIFSRVFAGKGKFVGGQK